MHPPRQSNRPTRLGGGLDELHYVFGVGNHRHVVRRDFDGGGAHPRGGPALGIGREGLIALRDQEQDGCGFQAGTPIMSCRARPSSAPR
jgi:hypothetical protein